jgi:hypothetical protein
MPKSNGCHDVKIMGYHDVSIMAATSWTLLQETMAAAMVLSILFLNCFVIILSNMISLSQNEMAQQIDKFLMNF